MAKIALDAGHGKHTLGKRCLKSLDKNETREWVLNDRVADTVELYLEEAGHTVLRVDDPTGKTDISLAKRVQTANNWDADIYVSIHHNAGVNGGSGGGTVVFACHNCGKVATELRDSVYKYAVQEGDLKGNRFDGTLNENFYVIANTRMPAILIECGFMDSSTDIELILDPKWSKKIAKGIALGICEVIGGKIESKKEPVKETQKKVVDAAENYKLVLEGKYKTTAKTKLRYGAGSKYDIVATVPANKTVKCTGYFTKYKGTRWFIVKYGKKRGFCSEAYLKRV